MENIKSIHLDGMKEQIAMNIIGNHDRNLIVLSSQFEKDISYRDNTFFVRNCSDEELQLIKRILAALMTLAEQNKVISEQDVIYASRLLAKEQNIDFTSMSSEIIGRTMSGKAIVPKTLLKKGDVKRIVLTRPAVEAGESLGFLPGDLKEKVDPYLTPLYDALHNMLGNEQTEKLIEKGTIEIAPLAYMRGRTLDDAYVILDEAQNTTASQMKMFLTRLGFGSHMIITGDVTQIDLNHNQTSGLIEATRILEGLSEIKIMELSADDVVRHPIVQKIIERYSKEDEQRRELSLKKRG